MELPAGRGKTCHLTDHPGHVPLEDAAFDEVALWQTQGCPGGPGQRVQPPRNGGRRCVLVVLVNTANAVERFLKCWIVHESCRLVDRQHAIAPVEADVLAG